MPTDGQLTVAISRSRLPPWDDSFVDSVMLPLLYAPRVAIEDPIAWAVGIRLDRNSPEVVAAHLEAALHVTQVLAPLIDEGYVHLLGPARGHGGMDDKPFFKMRMDDRIPAKRGEAAFRDLAIYFGCDFLASPWLPTEQDVEQFSTAIAYLGVDDDGPDRKTTMPSLYGVQRFKVPDLRGLEPSDIARLRGSPLHERWKTELAESLATCHAMLQAGLEFEEAQAQFVQRMQSASERYSSAQRSGAIRRIVGKGIRDTVTVNLGMLMTSPWRPWSTVSGDLLGSTGVVALSTIMSALSELRDYNSEERLVRDAIKAHFGVFLCGS